MATKYEVWKKDSFPSGKPISTVFVLDTAISLAKKHSVGTKIVQYWKADPNSQGGWWNGGVQKDLEIPLVCVVIERSTKSAVRGVGVNGSFKFAIDCPRCKGTAQDSQFHNLPCISCDQAGW